MDSHHDPHLYPVDDAFINDAGDITETLANLTYLIRADADCPDTVRLYADQAEERVRALGDLIRSVAPDYAVSERRAEIEHTPPSIGCVFFVLA
jgi:hypothetical protein